MRAALLVALLLAACGGGDPPQVKSRTECRVDANGRTICTTYEVKE